MKRLIVLVCLCTAMAGSWSTALAARKSRPAPQAELTESGKKLEAKYAAMLAALKAELSKDLSTVAEPKLAALQKAHAAAEALQEKANSTQEAAGDAGKIKAVIANWKKFWIGKANKGISKAQADLKAATTDAQRAAANQELAKWQANKAAGEKKIKEAEAELQKSSSTQPALAQASQAAQATLAQARVNELNAAKAVLADLEPCLTSDKLDAKLVKATVLAAATPNDLAAFAQQGKEQEALVEKLLADASLMKEMLIGGGAIFGKYGRAMEIFTAIQKASPKAREGEGVFHRLAVAASLELARPAGKAPAKQKAKKADEQQESPEGSSAVAPVQRYLSYAAAYLNGELDPAFKNLSVWEYRMVVNASTRDEELAWGRAMIRNYRPDLVKLPNYGWRYSALVKSDVTYGSAGCKNDRPELGPDQNILKDGGVCGRRATFGRFILQANGIPVWGATQHKHAALSHWTPKGWVTNLGAGFNHSWWDKSDVPMSGLDFLLETQARRHGQDYLTVLRAQWVSCILGEPAYNGRGGVAGGTWSSLAHYKTMIIAAQEVELGPLGEELAEVNVAEGSEMGAQETVTKEDQKVVVSKDGKIIIPAVAHGKSSGSATAMKSYAGGMQLLGSAGFKTQYTIEAPQAGKYALSARVVTVHEGHRSSFAANDAKAVEVPVPYTIGMWKQTEPVEVALNKGQNVLRFEILGAAKMVIKDFTLTPVK